MWGPQSDFRFESWAAWAFPKHVPVEFVDGTPGCFDQSKMTQAGRVR